MIAEGSAITHKRYGKAVVTNIWRILIDPTKRVTKINGVTFKILTKEGRDLYQKDRRQLFLHKPPLYRCYENKLHLIVIDSVTT